jgi:putative heme-binding domain-containing protein
LLCSINHRARPLIESLSKSPEFFDSPSGRVLLGDLAFQIGAEKNDADMTWLLTEVEAVRDDPALARVAVLGLGKGLQRSGGSLRSVLAGPAAKVVAPLFTKAAEVASGDGKAASRAEAVRLLGLGPVDVALTTLPDLLDARQPGNVQLAALQTLADLPDRRVGPEIIAHWKGLGPSVRREAAEALLARADRVAALLDALESKEIAPADLDPARRQQLISHSNPKVRERATRLIGKDAKSDRGPVIASYRKALDLDGNADRGREVFRKQCATCHKAEGVGTDVGPNLATITGRTPEDLLIHILDPNREVAPAYVNYTVETSDGQILTGLIADESANSVTLKRAEGATDTIPRARIEAMASTGLSLMPEGLEKEVSPEQLADLLAYVRGINTNAPAAPAP